MTTVFLFYHPKVPKMTKKLSRYLFIIWSETILMSKSANTTKKNVREIFPISTDQYEGKGIENSKKQHIWGRVDSKKEKQHIWGPIFEGGHILKRSDF